MAQVQHPALGFVEPHEVPRSHPAPPSPAWATGQPQDPAPCVSSLATTAGDKTEPVLFHLGVTEMLNPALVGKCNKFIYHCVINQ